MSDEIGDAHKALNGLEIPKFRDRAPFARGSIPLTLTERIALLAGSESTDERLLASHRKAHAILDQVNPNTSGQNVAYRVVSFLRRYRELEDLAKGYCHGCEIDENEFKRLRRLEERLRRRLEDAEHPDEFIDEVRRVLGL